MTKNTDKTPAATHEKIEELGLGGFALMLIKIIATTVTIVLILKYIFKLPIAI